MTTYADTCTRIYTPRGTMAHLSAPGWTGGKPLCPIPEPRGGWLGTGSQDEYERAAAMPTCPRCVKLAAERDSAPQTPSPAPCAPVTASTLPPEGAAGEGSTSPASVPDSAQMPPPPAAGEAATDPQDRSPGGPEGLAAEPEPFMTGGKEFLSDGPSLVELDAYGDYAPERREAPADEETLEVPVSVSVHVGTPRRPGTLPPLPAADQSPSFWDRLWRALWGRS